MLDTDQFLIKGLVPPKNTPPAWMPMQVNWRHPLAQGLFLCYLPLSPSGLTNIARSGGRMTPGSGLKLRPSAIGGGLLTDAANTQASVTAPDYAKPTSATVGTVHFQVSTPNSGNHVYFGVTTLNDANPYARYSLFRDNTSGHIQLHYSLGGSWKFLSSGVAPSIGTRKSVVGTISSGSQKIWTDGVSRASDTQSGAITYAANDVLQFGFLVVPNNYSGTNTQIGAAWDRVLLDEEIRLFDREPFCFLEPDMNGVWFKTPSVSGYTLNALPGSYSISGANARLLASRKLNALPGSYSISGANARLLASRKLNALPGSYSISGANARLLASRKLNAIPGSYSISGKTAQLTYSGSVAAIFGYYALEQALRTVLQSNSVGAFKYFIEGQDNDIQNLSNMPLVNIRIQESIANLVGIPNKYYETVAINIDVYAFDFTSYRDASRIRSSIIGAIRDVIIANKSFYSFLDVTLIEPGIQFDSGVLDGGKGHVAMATMTIMCGAYIN